jgi:hypothetical protein
MAIYNGLCIWVVCGIETWWSGVVCEDRKWIKLAQLCVAVLEIHFNTTDGLVTANDGLMRYLITYLFTYLITYLLNYLLIYLIVYLLTYLLT